MFCTNFEWKAGNVCFRLSNSSINQKEKKNTSLSSFVIQCGSSRAQWGGRGSVRAQTDLSRDVQSYSGLAFGWITQRHSHCCSMATSLPSWLCSDVFCTAERWAFTPFRDQELSAAGFHPGCVCTLPHLFFPSILTSLLVCTKNKCCYHASDVLPKVLLSTKLNSLLPLNRSTTKLTVPSFVA